MLSTKEITRVIGKMERSVKSWDPLQFRVLRDIDVEIYETTEYLYHDFPTDGYRHIEKGEKWGGEAVNGWFRGTIVIDDELAGRKLFLMEDSGALETLVFLNGKARGVLARKVVALTRGNHCALILTDNARKGDKLSLNIEAYRWHTDVGNGSIIFEEQAKSLVTASDPVTFKGFAVAELDEDVVEYVLRLKLALQMEKCARDEFVRAEYRNAIYDAYRVVTQVPTEVGEKIWRPQIRKATQIFSELLSRKNDSVSRPWVGLTGHSHLDTAWLWTVNETVKKAARTYSNALTMMDVYPEYRFIQSSALHGQMMKDYYPEIFEGIRKRVKEGRWEPNGAVWVECDCNMTGAEAMVRQFMYGQMFTRKEYGYTSDVFWLPDTFGYSAALPQIMKLSKVKYFFTTKMAWNDTNKFPYDTFYWQGIDKSKVLANLNDIHRDPSVEAAHAILYEMKGDEKRISKSRYLAFGCGDGGAGPTYDQCRMADLVKNIDGAPRMEYMSASEYMHRQEKEAHEIPTYAGELYLELHRGTLTEQAEIKRGNRRAEEALHALDVAAVVSRLQGKAHVSNESEWKALLINQFHDILPGTAIKEVNIKAVKDLNDLESNCWKKTCSLLEGAKTCIYNPAPFERSYSIVADDYENAEPITTTSGRMWYGKMSVPAYSAVPVSFEKLNGCSFSFENRKLETPFYRVVFDEDGIISSLYDKDEDRELAGPLGLDRFYVNEDVPEYWDNWDIEKELVENLHKVEGDSSFELLEILPSSIAFTRKVAVTDNSTVEEIIRFWAEEKRIDFDLVLDWHDVHKVLKIGFDLDINSTDIRNEIHFGHIKRPFIRTNCFDEAKYEYSMHKWCDISEPGYGVSLINDCKYGMDARPENGLTITLIKSGTHPDPRGDAGVHRVSYAINPHKAFTAESVIKEAYLYNETPRVIQSDCFNSLVSSDKANVIVETVKLAENENAVVLRIYEAEGTSTWAEINVSFEYSSVKEVNFLEEELSEVDTTRIHFKAFEIKTLMYIL